MSRMFFTFLWFFIFGILSAYGQESKTDSVYLMNALNCPVEHVDALHKYAIATDNEQSAKHLFDLIYLGRCRPTTGGGTIKVTNIRTPYPETPRVVCYKEVWFERTDDTENCSLQENLMSIKQAFEHKTGAYRIVYERDGTHNNSMKKVECLEGGHTLYYQRNKAWERISFIYCEEALSEPANSMLTSINTQTYIDGCKGADYLKSMK